MNTKLPIKESNLIKAFLELWQIRNPLSRLFRNNTGAWKDRLTGRLIRYGLCKGSSDLIGWTVKPLCELLPHVIRPAVEQSCIDYPNGCKDCTYKVAVFTAYEAKTPKDKPTPEQKIFIDLVKKSGGIAEIIKVEDLK